MPFSASAAAVRAKREPSSRVCCRRSGSAGKTIATRDAEIRPMVLRMDHAPSRASLVLLIVGQSAEYGDAIGFGPKAHHAGLREGGILDCEQRLAVEDDVEAGASELNPQGVPLLSRHSCLYAVATLLADEVE